MSQLVRFGVSMDKRLLATLDAIVKRRGYANRSEAMRESWESGKGPAVATLTIVYDHHVHEVDEHLTDLQHDHEDLVHSAMHVHLSHRMCLEVIVMRGKPKRIQNLADRLTAARGVKHGQLVVTADEELV